MILNMESGDFDIRLEVRDQVRETSLFIVCLSSYSPHPSSSSSPSLQVARVRVTLRPTCHRMTLRSQTRAELAFLPATSSPLSQLPIMAEDLQGTYFLSSTAGHWCI
jgi:hypothetical protein